MHFSTIFAAATFLSAASAAAITNSKRTTVELTLNDYPSFADGRADNNPPTCGMSYKDLNLDKITALGGLIIGSDCGKCARVCGDVGCQDLLVVDLCTLENGHLDISTGAGNAIVGSDTGRWQVSVEYVDQSNCEGIWNGKMFWDWEKPSGELANLYNLQGGADSVPKSSMAAVAESTPCTTTQAPVYTPAYTPTPTPTSETQVYTQPATSEAPVYTPAPTSEAPVYTPAPETSSPAPVVYSTPEAVSSPAPVYSTPEIYSTQAAEAYSTPAAASTPVYSSAEVEAYSSALPVYAPEKSAEVSYASFQIAVSSGYVTPTASGTGYYPSGTGSVTYPSSSTKPYSSPSPSVIQFTGAASSNTFNVFAIVSSIAATLLFL